MIAASFELIQSGNEYSVWGVFWGILIGIVIIYAAKKIVERYESNITFGPTTGKTASQLLLFFSVMTVHSGVEGIAMGFAFGPGWSLGLTIVLVMAIQNIPE